MRNQRSEQCLSSGSEDKRDDDLPDLEYAGWRGSAGWSRASGTASGEVFLARRDWDIDSVDAQRASLLSEKGHGKCARCPVGIGKRRISRSNMTRLRKGQLFTIVLCAVLHLVIVGSRGHCCLQPCVSLMLQGICTVLVGLTLNLSSFSQYIFGLDVGAQPNTTVVLQGSAFMTEPTKPSPMKPTAGAAMCGRGSLDASLPLSTREGSGEPV